MFFKFEIFVLIAFFCVSCSEKEVKRDLDVSDETAKCREKKNIEECENVEIEHCASFSGVNPKDCEYYSSSSYTSSSSCEVVPGGTMCKDDLLDKKPYIMIGSYADGDVALFSWRNTLPWYYETDEHLYGFDKDPMSNWPNHIEAGRDVYVSTIKGKPAAVELKIPLDYSKISLVNEEDVKICSGRTCNGIIQLDEGKYRLLNDGEDLERNLSVIAYEKKGPYEITYVQFNGDNSVSCPVDQGCYTKESVQKSLDEIFSQALVDVVLDELKPSEIGYDDIYEIDMTDGFDEDTYDRLLYKILSRSDVFMEFDRAKRKYDESDKNCEIYTKEGNTTLKEKWCNQKKEDDVALKEKSKIAASNPVRVVVAINDFRYIWKLSNQSEQDKLYFYGSYKEINKIYLSLYGKRASSGSEIPMFLKSISNECVDGAGEKPVPVVAKFLHGLSEPMVISLYDLSGNLISFNKECDYIYIDTHSFIPGMEKAAQVTFRYQNDEKKIVGGVSLAIRQKGEASQNTIVHEIGHLFGLSDLYIDEKDPSVPSCLEKDEDGNYKYKVEKDSEDGSNLYIFDTYKCEFVTTEANLMNHVVPTGPKLRYRPLPIVKSGTNDRVGTFDSQWECLQNADCGMYDETK